MRILDLGKTDYGPAWDIQKDVAEEVVGGGEDTLILVEHAPVLTLGASFHEENLLMTPEEYRRRGIEVVRTDRGGDVTYHGPGQLVIYPVFNLKRHGQDLHKWMRDLEEAVIVLLDQVGLSGLRFAPHTGVWLRPQSDSGQAPLRKVAAIGVKVRKWVSIHGVAINCNNDLSPFGLIVPCGIIGYGVTSLSESLGRSFSVQDAKAPAVASFEKVFGA